MFSQVQTLCRPAVNMFSSIFPIIRSGDGDSGGSSSSNDSSPLARQGQGPSNAFEVLGTAPSAAVIADQVRAAREMIDNLPSIPALENIPKIVYKGVEYILEEHIAGRRGRNSWVSHHGFYLTQLTSKGTGQTYWCCQTCDRRGRAKLFQTSSTTNAIKHLRR